MNFFPESILKPPPLSASVIKSLLLPSGAISCPIRLPIVVRAPARVIPHAVPVAATDVKKTDERWANGRKKQPKWKPPCSGYNCPNKQTQENLDKGILFHRYIF